VLEIEYNILRCFAKIFYRIVHDRWHFFAYSQSIIILVSLCCSIHLQRSRMFYWVGFRVGSVAVRASGERFPDQESVLAVEIKVLLRVMLREKYCDTLIGIKPGMDPPRSVNYCISYCVTATFYYLCESYSKFVNDENVKTVVPHVVKFIHCYRFRGVRVLRSGS